MNKFLKKIWQSLLPLLNTYSPKWCNFMGLYLTLESFKKMHAPFKFYIRFCFIFSIILGCLILYNISISQTDMNYWLKILVRIFLVLGIVLKSCAEYSCFKHNMKKFTGKEFRALKIFIVIKFIFYSVLTVFFLLYLLDIP